MSGVNVEDPDPTPEPAPVAAAPEPPPVPEPPPDPDEANAIEVQGGKMVPLPALKATREELRQAKEQLAKLPQYEQQIAQLQGSLQTFQQVQQQLQRPPAAPPPADADPDLVELAKSLDYIDPTTGRPDTARAANHLALIERRAQKIADARLAPLQEQHAKATSDANYQRVAQMKTPKGVAVPKAILDTMWQNLPASYTADPRIAQALGAMAYGLAELSGQGSQLPPAPPVPGPPLHTEGLTGSPPRRSVVTDAEREVISARGIKEDKYVEMTKGFKPGRATQLED